MELKKLQELMDMTIEYCFYVTMTLTSYIISAQLDTLGMLIMIYMAEALIIALFVKKRIFVEYFAFSFIGLIAVGIFQTEEINIFFSTFIYIIYLLFCQPIK